MNKEERAQRLIVDEVSKVLDLLHNQVDDFCKKNNTENVPKSLMQHYIKIVKDSYSEGALKRYKKK
ncbi:MAG: hypothetical protein NXI20_17770 [bacterium]|nr:hypothetical protein [bacterium]